MCHAHAGVAGRVRGDGSAGQVRGVDDGLQFRGGQRGRGVAAGADAVVGVQLDPVGAAGGLLAHRAHRFVRAADFLRAAGQVEIGTEAARTGAVAGAGDDGTGGDIQARAGNQAFVDRALDRDVGVAGAFGAQVAQRGEAGQQRVARVRGGFQRAVVLRLLQHLVVPQRLVVGMQEHVRVEVDQARHQRRARQRDALRVGGRPHRRRIADRLDGAVADQHDPAGMQGHPNSHPVESASHR